MINAIGAISGNSNYQDPEYIKILQELYKLGIKPSGKKNVDKTKLEAEKNKLIEKIQEKTETKQPDNSEYLQREKLETQKLGAMNVAELNKILHGLI